DLVDVGRLALRLGAREVADEDDLLVRILLDHRQGAGQRRRAHVVGQEEHLLAVQELDGVPDAGLGVVPVVGRPPRAGPAESTAARIDIAVVRLGSAIQLGAESSGGPAKRRAHADPDLVRSAVRGRCGTGEHAGRQRGHGHTEEISALHATSCTGAPALAVVRSVASSRGMSSTGTISPAQLIHPLANARGPRARAAAGVSSGRTASKGSRPRTESTTAATTKEPSRTTRVRKLRADRAAGSPSAPRMSTIGTIVPRRLATPTRCRAARGTRVISSNTATSRALRTSTAWAEPPRETRQARRVGVASGEAGAAAMPGVVSIEAISRTGVRRRGVDRRGTGSRGSRRAPLVGPTPDP